MKKGWIEGFFVDCQSPTISITTHPIHRWVNEEKVCQVSQCYYARLQSLKFMYIHTVGRSLAWEGKSDLCQLMYPHMALQDVKFQHPEKKTNQICIFVYEPMRKYYFKVEKIFCFMIILKKLCWPVAFPIVQQSYAEDQSEYGRLHQFHSHRKWLLVSEL